jgi:hypothetical protein
MKYVIRSMSTTDAPNCVPYHCFLAWPEHRNWAWWTASEASAMRFGSIEEAEEEWDRLNLSSREGSRSDIAPLHHPTPVWKETFHRPKVSTS